MVKKDRKFAVIDILYLVLAILPLVVGMVIDILTETPSGEGLAISGARIFFTIPMPFQDLTITESQINSWLVILTIFWLCKYFVHGVKEKPETKRQHIAEWIVEKTESLVQENMGDYFKGFAPFIAAIMALSAFSSLISLLGLYPPTSDLNIVGGWAILVFVLITYYKMKCGPWYYVKGFFQPIPLLAPMNIISEIATPVSMTLRHFGNILSGSVISALLAMALGGLSKAVLGWLPGVLADIPFLSIGIPAVLSVYFDLFSGLMQAFIFAMLTMAYIQSAFPQDDYEKRKALKKKRKIINENS